MMKHRNSIALLALVISSMSTHLFASDSTKNDFETKLYRSEAVSPLGMDVGRLTKLTQVQRDDLIGAKGVLVLFFRELEDVNKNPMPLLTKEFARKYPDRTALAQDILGQEVAVLQFGITDFELTTQSKVVLKFYLLLDTEGSFAVTSGAATMDKTSGAWKINDLNAVGQ